MNKIRTIDELLQQVKQVDGEKIFWFGTRGSDVLGLTEALNIQGVMSCYGDNFDNCNVATNFDDSNQVRRKTNGDELSVDLLENEAYQEFILKQKFTAVLPYDAPAELEKFCSNHNIKCFSSPSNLKDLLRDKTKIEDMSKSINLPIIPGVSGILDEFDYDFLVTKLGNPLFLQFEGSAGSGNFIIHNSDEFENIKQKMRGQKLNIKKYFEGRACSVDICITKNSVLCGTLEDMLIGAEPLNTNPTEYVGGSWVDGGYSVDMRKKILDAATSLGEYMRGKGFLGYFHPDFLVDSKNVYLTEVNMRFGGSCGIYAKAELAQKRVLLMGAHLLSFVKPEQTFDAEKINNINLQPMNYSFMVIKNTRKELITIPKELKSGLYKIEQQSLKFIDPDINFEKLTDSDLIEIIGLPSNGSDTVVEHGAFLCQVVTTLPIIDNRNKLNQTGMDIAKRIYQMFK